MNEAVYTPQALNKAMLEAVVSSILESGIRAPPLCPGAANHLWIPSCRVRMLPDPGCSDNLPHNLLPGSRPWVTMCPVWPGQRRSRRGTGPGDHVYGSAVPGSQARPARLFSVCSGETELTLLQLRH